MSLSRNVPLAYAYNFFQMCLIVVPVLVPYYQSLGLTISEVLQIQAAFGISLALFEVPTGYIADLWSRKASVCLGAFLAGCCFTYLPFATTYESLMAFQITMGLAAALSSGADTALVYDSLPPNAPRLKILGALNVWALLGETVASIAGGVLVLYSFSAVTWAQACVMWAPFFIALFFVEPPIERMQRTGHLSNCTKVIKHVLSEDSLLRLIFLNCVVWGLSSFCVVWLQQAYWTRHGVPLSFFGIIWAALMLVAVVASKWTHRYERLVGAPVVLLTLSIVPCIGYFLMALDLRIVGIAAAALFYINRGLASVLLQDAFNWKIPSTFRATGNSLKSLAFRGSASVLTPLVGLAVDRWGLPAGLFILGSAFSILLLLLALPLYHRIHELHVEYIPTDGISQSS
jgi:MFS family permease